MDNTNAAKLNMKTPRDKSSKLDFNVEPDSLKIPNTEEIIVSLANELQNIGDKLSESYQLPFVHKVKFARTVSFMAVERGADVFVMFLKAQW